MAVSRCHICEQEPDGRHRFMGEELAEGNECPLCYEPTCRRHLATVRWRWKADGQVGSDQICQTCKRAYRHRSWDPLNRDWIS